MKKNNGFTLIELVAVIILIGLISTLAIIPINNAVKKSREDLYEKQKQEIILATMSWVVDHPYEVPPYMGGSDYIDITIEKMISDGYLDTKVVDMRDKSDIGNCSYVRVTLNADGIDGNKNTYKYNFNQLKEEDCVEQ